METKLVLAWMFVREDLRIAGAVVEAGKTLIAKSTSDAGNRIAIRPLDALRHAPDPIVCRVETNATPSGRSVKVLWLADASKVLHTFACDAAEQALDTAGVTDESIREAIVVKRRWLKGEATDEELRTARARAREVLAAESETRIDAQVAAVWTAARAMDWAAEMAARAAWWAAVWTAAESEREAWETWAVAARPAVPEAQVAAWVATAESEARTAAAARLNADLEARLMTLAA